MVSVAVLGATGQIGQPLSLLLKSVGQAPRALTGADVVLISAGIARKPGMTRDDLFATNEGIISSLVSGVATFCPNAFICIITNPVNSTVPIAAQALRSHGVFDPTRLFGVTTLDVVRSSTFVSHVLPDIDPRKLKVPVVGGHSGATILPLLSQAEPQVKLTQEQIESITYRVQFGGDEIVKAKAGAGSATTCMAYAAFRFAQAIIKATKGDLGIVEPAYIFLPGVSNGDLVAKELGVDYFAVPVTLSTGGVQKAHSIGPLSDYENKLLDVAVGQLKSDIKKGECFTAA